MIDAATVTSNLPPQEKATPEIASPDPSNNDADDTACDGQPEPSAGEVAEDAVSKEGEHDSKHERSNENENPSHDRVVNDTENESPLIPQTPAENMQSELNDFPVNDASEGINGGPSTQEISSGLVSDCEPQPALPGSEQSELSQNNDRNVACTATETMENDVKVSISELDQNTAQSSQADNSIGKTNNPANDGGADDDADFVAIELASPKKHASSPTSTLDPPTATHATISESPSDPDGSFVQPNDTPAPITSPPARRKILRHPILTPLTKLPWDRFISAAGACDLLFNCKYSMAQVEDEVREQQLENGGVGDARVGREDGYVNLSLGNNESPSCGFEEYNHYGEEDGCHADEYAELGLDCCSMLDIEEDDDEVEVVMARDRPNHYWEECGQREQVDGGGVEEPMEGDVQLQNVVSKAQDQTIAPNANVFSEEERAEASWKRSNPSLDMMLYRTMISD
mmetsp:Transcript_25818/g.44087  ORF Transcript_25818/g.44087 Transcript_25818/m.44087 type:complete len:459 (-) Transcript_25818:102-1478(-)|eukprot:CAMPEP_0183724784 /NCGR_PEP_ID=MMETSP0737-20130205/18544_1 /TAXON_ID=385413 /ORGANISM="Thalassiosira miniscula, Strain CCMP1093" /LENGTH=458 /DNA_ID=CAMNT_0025955493 /DNA_START=115 /DNA_END=1491 /DNA_ORIENTATION=+